MSYVTCSITVCIIDVCFTDSMLCLAGYNVVVVPLAMPIIYIVRVLCKHYYTSCTNTREKWREGGSHVSEGAGEGCSVLYRCLPLL